MINLPKTKSNSEIGVIRNDTKNAKRILTIETTKESLKDAS